LSFSLCVDKSVTGGLKSVDDCRETCLVVGFLVSLSRWSSFSDLAGFSVIGDSESNGVKFNSLTFLNQAS
jgi:hypothetical protein